MFIVHLVTLEVEGDEVVCVAGSVCVCLCVAGSVSVCRQQSKLRLMT